ncbi:leucine--tRNA ligase [Candidatus Woesearchaeota archaeon]|nr:MAG: leucine--tRNA ligase [Candidatus Woesearchaeota archaeon]
MPPSTTPPIDLRLLPKKWQKRWERAGIFKTREDPAKEKYYVLEMYPYPSGSGLHMGHARNYCIGDAYARYQRMRGKNVLYPMGYDSFGLPAENAAIKAKSHPKKFTEAAIEQFKRQQRALGLSYDWDRLIMSHDPSFYQWDQWLFLKLYEKGLVYRKKSIVNWCPACQTVLANEQVHNGTCWRHEDTNVEIKDLEQWFIKTTAYAEELLKGLDSLDHWPDDVKTMQRNWIGKSTGTIIEFPVEGSDKKLRVFTTRPDTFFGITFLVYAPEHPDVKEFVKGTPYEKQTKAFIEKVLLQDRFQRTAEDKEKEGLFIGKYAINPLTKEKIPIYIANFVLYEYGTGAIIAVPAHDQRDFLFAKKYNIPIKVVINPPDFDLDPSKMSRAYTGDGYLVNSAEFNGMHNRDAMEAITEHLKAKKCGGPSTQYKLRDWLVSRQRFWGCPIPMIHCEECGIVPVPEKELPVRLPEDFTFTATEGNPLAHCEAFVNTTCPSCGKPAKRETDTMDTFFDSSWYFLRYCDQHNHTQPFSPKKAAYWMPIDTYIGGKEHATMHLIYFRFFTKFLRDIGFLSIDEPCIRLFNQGMVHKEGTVMSKSKGNVVTQEEIEKTFGIDTARFFLLFVASPDKDLEWDDKGVAGAHRFLTRIIDLYTRKELTSELPKNQESKLHRTIRDVTTSIESFKFNNALVSIMQFAHYLIEEERVSTVALKHLAKLLAPFTPHLAEELWELLDEQAFISLAPWPAYDESKIDEELESHERTLKTTIADLQNVKKLSGIARPKQATLFIAAPWKYSLVQAIKEELSKGSDAKTLFQAVMQRDEVKQHGQEAAKLIPRLAKDQSKLPLFVSSPENERAYLEEKKNIIAKRAQLEAESIKVVHEQESKEAKARQSLPGKPAILLL